MIKPSKIQVLFAQNWLWHLLFWGCALCVGLTVAMPTYITQKTFIRAIMSGAITGVLISCFITRGLYYIITRINGSPFHKGDTVQILIGEYKGQVVNVYEEWKDRKDVRVDLGEIAMKDVKDVFSFNEICRVDKTEDSSIYNNNSL
jgi:hypothetical protein